MQPGPTATVTGMTKAMPGALWRRRGCLWRLALLLAVVAMATAAQGHGVPAKPTLQLRSGVQYDADTIHDAVMPTGHRARYIVATEVGFKDAVLADLTAAFPTFQPQHEMNSLHMFVAQLSLDEIRFLLHLQRVKFVEEDGEVHATGLSMQ
eukprot:jgi/Chlat1/5005/Chrsp32S04978